MYITKQITHSISTGGNQEMDTVHGVSRVRHNVVTKPTNPPTDIHSNYSEPMSVASLGQVLGAIR